MQRTLPILSLVLVVSCGGSPTTGSADLAGLPPNADLSMTGTGNIPDPGNGTDVDNNFGDVEPNDTPAQATPLGKSALTEIHIWVSGNNIGGTDTTDYFVFNSGTANVFTFNLCWSGQVTNINATLWKVANSQQVMPPIHQWTGSGSCVQTSIPGDGAAPDAPLEANTNYLFGLQATGGAGMYTA
jgi:hypothetical protein